MFILMIARGVPTPQDPQWGCFEKDQAEALAALGHKVVVASVDSRFRLKWRHIGITHYHINNVDYYDSFWIPGKITDFGGRFFNWKIKELQFRRIYSMVKKLYGKPDIICGHFSFCTYTAVDIANEESIPLVGIEHNAIFNEQTLTSHTAYSSKIAYKNTSQIIAVSQNLKNRIKYHLGYDSIVVNNLIGSEFLNAPIAHHTQNLSFVAVGTLEYRKGYDILIKALANAKIGKSWTLKIIGEGSYRKQLSQLIQLYHLENKIALLGKKSKSEIVDILTLSSIFVMPSRNENFSVALLEALACGLPTIASDCGGAKDCINDLNGLIVPIEDEKSLKTAIEQMAQRMDEYNNEVIAQDCRKRFSPQAIASQLTEVFNNTIHNYKH